jgi:FixJ family two-component response regulator
MEASDGEIFKRAARGEYGFSDYMAKPISKKAFIEAVEKALTLVSMVSDSTVR